MHVDLSRIDWTAVAAIATALLAVMTWWLAVSTRKLAKETTQDVAAAFRPVVLGDAPEIEVSAKTMHDEHEVIRFSIRLVNEGHGPALNCRYEVEGGSVQPDSSYRRTRSVPSKPFPSVRLKESVTLEPGLMTTPPPPYEGRALPQRYIVTLRYEDIGQNEHTTVLTYESIGGFHHGGMEMTYDARLIDVETK